MVGTPEYRYQFEHCEGELNGRWYYLHMANTDQDLIPVAVRERIESWIANANRNARESAVPEVVNYHEGYAQALRDLLNVV